MEKVHISGCILSKFHIKPQQRVRHKIGHSVVSYRNSTSNHNSAFVTKLVILLYLIEIPHQTTTYSKLLCLFQCCILSKFHIKPQLVPCGKCEDCRCILSKFHIKPQLVRNYYGYSQVVSYRNSTSNHNKDLADAYAVQVVSYRNSTSNHNVGPHID